MPIKGISNQRRMRRLGKVRLGEKKINDKGKEYPSALDHFNFEDAPELLAIYGPNCKTIDVMIPNENVDAFFPQERKCYRTSGLFCRGDGETATRVHVGLSDGDKNAKAVPKGQPLDPAGAEFIKEQGLKLDVGDMFDMPCLGEDCPFTEKKLCKPIGRFMFMVPKAQRVGVFEISTTSYNSIIEINSAIDTIRVIAGRISMIPLKLSLVPKETKVPKTTMKKTIHHLVMEFAGTIADLSQYRNAKQIPMEQLPTRHELEQHIPEDLIPKQGGAMDAELAGENNIAGPAEAAPPAKEVGSNPVKIQAVLKGKGVFKIKGELDYFTKLESIAKTAKALLTDGDPAMIEWERGADGVYWITSIDRHEVQTAAAF